MSEFKEIKWETKHGKTINRYTVDDPIFGKLNYHTPFKPYTPEEINFVCKRPFTSCEVSYKGEVIICCHDWLPLSIGNVLTNTMQEIWSGEKAEALRNSITDGSYRYCNNQTCLYLISKDGELIDKSEFQNPNNSLPTTVLFSVDESCNLYCPSCRTEKIGQLEGEHRNTALEIVRNTIRQLCNKPHNNSILIGFDGRGEVFNSQVYKEIFETEFLFSNLDLWPNIRFRILTNGVMMTEKIQTRHAKIFNRIEGISVSIDAGNEESYNKVRLGGNWSLLWKNLDYLYTTQKHRPVSSFDWAWQVVLQADNYESIPELIQLAYNYPERLPLIVISPILNWGTFSPEVFLEKTVMNKESEKYKRLKQILSTPLVKNYPRLLAPKLD